MGHPDGMTRAGSVILIRTKICYGKSYMQAAKDAMGPFKGT